VSFKRVKEGWRFRNQSIADVPLLHPNLLFWLIWWFSSVQCVIALPLIRYFRDLFALDRIYLSRLGLSSFDRTSFYYQNDQEKLRITPLFSSLVIFLQALRFTFLSVLLNQRFCPLFSFRFFPHSVLYPFWFDKLLQQLQIQETLPPLPVNSLSLLSKILFNSPHKHLRSQQNQTLILIFSLLSRSFGQSHFAFVVALREIWLLSVTWTLCHIDELKKQTCDLGQLGTREKMSDASGVGQKEQFSSISHLSLHRLLSSGVDSFSLA